MPLHLWRCVFAGWIGGHTARRWSRRMPSSSASPLLPIAPSFSSSSSSSSSSLHRRQSSSPFPRNFSTTRSSRWLVREAIVPFAWDCPMKRYRKISMGGAGNPGDGSPARRLHGGARWGPSGPPGGGIDIDYCAFPTCPGNPRGIVSAPALRFCTLLPPPPSPTLSASHRQRRASLLLSARLSRFLSLSLSLSSRFCLSLPFPLSFFT